MELVRTSLVADVRFSRDHNHAEFSATSTLPESAKTPPEVAAWYSESFAPHFDKLAAT